MAGEHGLRRLHLHEREHAAEARGAANVRHIFEQAEKFGVVVGVGGVFVRGGSGVIECRESSGVNARRSVQGIDFEAGIISEDVGARAGYAVFEAGKVLQPFGEFARFLRGVLREGGLVFDDLGRFREIFQAQVTELAAEHGLDFLDLVGVACGDDESGHGEIWLTTDGHG